MTSPADLRALLNAAYAAGWDESGEGYNGEIQGPAARLEPEDRAHFEQQRDQAVAALKLPPAPARMSVAQATAYQLLHPSAEFDVRIYDGSDGTPVISLRR